MALALDASTPALATNGGGGNASESVTSNSFSPPANAVIVVVCLSNMTAGSSTLTGSITDSLASHLNWTEVTVSVDFSRRSGITAIWWAPVTSAPGAMTVSVTLTASGSAIYEMGVVPLVWTGADMTNPIGATTGGDGSTSSANLSVSITPTQTGSALLMGANDSTTAASVSAGSGCYAPWGFNSGGGDGSVVWFGTGTSQPTLTSNLSAQTLTATTGVSTSVWDWFAFEVLAATTPPSYVPPALLTTQAVKRAAFW